MFTEVILAFKSAGTAFRVHVTGYDSMLTHLPYTHSSLCAKGIACYQNQCSTPLISLAWMTSSMMSPWTDTGRLNVRSSFH